MAGVPFSNDGSFFEQFQKMQQQIEQTADKPSEVAGTRPEEAAQPATQESASAQCSKSASPALPASDASVDNDFIPSTSFTGSMEGFAFTTGEADSAVQACTCAGSLRLPASPLSCFETVAVS